MKKLILLLLFSPFIAIGQTAIDYYNKANTYSDNDQHQLAITYYTKAINLNPNDDFLETLYAFRGNSYGKLERTDEAMADYNKAISVSSSSEYSYYCRGNLYRDLGDNDAAIADYSRALIVNHKYKFAYLARGFMFEILELNESASIDYTSAINSDPDYASSWKYRGLARKKLGWSYCADFKKACDLGDNKSCDWYYKECNITTE